MEHFFDHEQLEVYQLAREFNREVHKLLGEVSRGHAESKDNLTRAAKSITRNIAEGSGKWKVADKVNLSRTVAMLIGMIRSLETRGAPDMSR